MLEKFEYINWSCEIFDGFYETHLGNPNCILYESENNIPDGYVVDIWNYRGYQNEIGEFVTDLLFEKCGVVKNYKFKEVSSPAYYNYSTDKLVVEVECDIDELKDFCFEHKREEFSQYLKENFTSRDGFCSFVANNLIDFYSEFKDENTRERSLNVMLEFYLLQTVEFDDLEDELYEGCEDIAYKYLALEKDGKYYNYDIDYRTDTVLVLDEKGL